MDTRLTKLFHDYERAFNALEVDKQAPFFAEHFISAGPQGSIAVGREEFLRRFTEHSWTWATSRARRRPNAPSKWLLPAAVIYSDG
jgi:hypothetical protein